LLGFEAISAEITVAYESTEGPDDLSQTVAMNHEKWGSMIDRPLGRCAPVGNGFNPIILV